MSAILAFVVVLSLLIFVHEFGHFIFAKIFGARVEEFGFGFPPRIWGIKKGETIYSINWIPVGGFVRIKGEIGGESHDPDSFVSKSGWQRLLILLAGVLMNVILAAVLFGIGSGIGLPQIIDDIPSSATVRDRAITVTDVLPDSPAELAGIGFGDQITGINGKSIETVSELQGIVQALVGEEVEVELKSGEETQKVFVTPTVLEETGGPAIGVGLVETGIVSYPWYLAPIRGVEITGIYLKAIVVAFADLFMRLVTGQAISADISGPIGIAVITGQVAKLGFVYLLQFTALLSLNLAIINILPLPALDGGRIVFLAIEKIRGRAVSERVEQIVHQAGFAILMFLVVLITFNDVRRFGGTIMQGFRNLFG